MGQEEQDTREEAKQILEALKEDIRSSARRRIPPGDEAWRGTELEELPELGKPLKDYADELIELRRQGWSVEDLATRYGVHPNYISEITKEGGPFPFPRKSKVRTAEGVRRVSDHIVYSAFADEVHEVSRKRIEDIMESGRVVCEFLDKLGLKDVDPADYAQDAVVFFQEYSDVLPQIIEERDILREAVNLLWPLAEGNYKEIIKLIEMKDLKTIQLLLEVEEAKRKAQVSPIEMLIMMTKKKMEKEAGAPTIQALPRWRPGVETDDR